MHELSPKLALSSCGRPFAELTAIRLAHAVQLESMDESHVILFHGLTGRRLQVSRRVHDLLLRLQRTATVADLIAWAPSAATLLEMLYQRAFLVDADDAAWSQPRRLLAPSAHTMFHCPRVPAAEHLNAQADVVFLGVPFDLGSTVVGGQRRGPAELRIASNQFIYETSLEDGRSLGWYDFDSGNRILEGVRILDAGDFCFEHGEPVDSIYQRLGSVWHALQRFGALPVSLGGDHSITFPLVERMQRDRDIALIWFDAHTDESFYRHGQSHHYGNVLTRTLGLSGVRKVIRVGTRGPVSTCREVNSERCRTISARELQRFGPSVLEDAIPAGLPCYVSIDLDVLDPSVAPAVGTPVPGGLTLHELEDAVAAVALRARVEALDLVELNPGLMPGNLTACVSSRVLLSALQAIMLSRRERAAELKTQNLEEDRACTA